MEVLNNLRSKKIWRNLNKVNLKESFKKADRGNKTLKKEKFKESRESLKSLKVPTPREIFLKGKKLKKEKFLRNLPKEENPRALKLPGKEAVLKELASLRKKKHLKIKQEKLKKYLEKNRS